MSKWTVAQIVYHTTERKAEVTLNNAMQDHDQPVTVSLSGLSIHDGLDAARDLAVTMILSENQYLAAE